MPDQPADPIHYDMKIPPEPKDATLNADEARAAQQRGSDGDRKTSDSEHFGSDDIPS